MLVQDYKYEYIVFIWPTFECNMTYQCEQENVEILSKHVSDTYKGKNSLIILDDSASGHDVNNKTSEIEKLG